MSNHDLIDREEWHAERLEQRKQEIILQQMNDERLVRDSIVSIMDDNVRTGIIDRSLDDFFKQCRNAGLDDFPKVDLSCENTRKVLDAASALFNELFDRIYYDVLEADALKQAEKEGVGGTGTQAADGVHS